jgi:acetyl-CoA carboxylase beta subunit/acetyl-CoA carboxylase alpha subunit
MFGKNRALEMYHALRSYKRITSREVIDALYTEFIPWQELITQGFSPVIRTPAGHELTIDPDPSEKTPPPQTLLKKTGIVGTGIFQNKRIAVIAQQTPPSLALRGDYNYGLTTADDYILAIAMMRFAEANNLAIHTFIDTVGGDPFTRSAEKLQSWLISECIRTIIATPVVTISVIVGQGGSGGAIALQPADVRLMLDSADAHNGAFYSVIDPKGGAAILFRSDSDDAVASMIEILQPTADSMLACGIIDRIIPEAALESLDYKESTLTEIKCALENAHDTLLSIDNDKRIIERRERIMRVGAIALSRHWYTGLRHFTFGLRTKASRIQETSDPYIAQIRLHVHQQNGVRGDPDFITNVIPRVCEDDRDQFDKKIVLRKGCRQYIEDGAFEECGFSCPHCSKPDCIDGNHVVELLFDQAMFYELHHDLTIEHIKGWEHFYNYSEQRKRAEKRASAKEALIVGYGSIHGLAACAAISHFPYMGGAFDAACGEKFRLITEEAIRRSYPLIIYTATGGMSMWNGTVALWQMAKTTLSMIKMGEAGLPTITIIGHPTTGGTFASYALQSDYLIGERKAETRFAGRRVVTLSSGGKDIDIHATSTEFFQQHGLLHFVSERRQLKSAVYGLLRNRYSAKST